jgi:hypothetical protein
MNNDRRMARQVSCGRDRGGCEWAAGEQHKAACIRINRFAAEAQSMSVAMSCLIYQACSRTSRRSQAMF